MKFKSFIYLPFVALLVSGCASSSSDKFAVKKLTPEGKNVTVLLSASKAVELSCKKIQEVKAYPPYILPDDARNTLRNETAKLGGNAIVITNYLIGIAKGDAYKCK